MTTNMSTLELSLDPNEADALRRDIEELEAASGFLIPFNSRLRELHYLLKMYGAKI